MFKNDLNFFTFIEDEYVNINKIHTGEDSDTSEPSRTTLDNSFNFSLGKERAFEIPNLETVSSQTLIFNPL